MSDIAQLAAGLSRRGGGGTIVWKETKTMAKSDKMDGSACTDWQPSEKQRAALAAYQDRDYGCTIEQACEAAGVSRRAYYYWHDDPRFSEWWEDQSKRYFRLQLPRVQAATLAAATGKDCTGSADRKLFFERFDRDYCPQQRSKTEHTGSVGVALDLSGMDAAALERLAHAVDDPKPAAPPASPSCTARSGR